MVDRSGLENRQACKGLVGSNPTPSGYRRISDLRHGQGLSYNISSNTPVVVVEWSSRPATLAWP